MKKQTKRGSAKTKKQAALYNRNKKILLLLSIILFASVGLLLLRGSSASTQWTLFWSDEFSGNSLDTNNWGVYHNTYGDGNQEEACLTPNNVTVSNGTLKITAKKEDVRCPNQSKVDNFTSGFISTRSIGSNGSGSTSDARFFPLHARYEMRAKIPHAQGLWPAFWLRHKNGAGIAEVDVMEYFHSQVPGKVTSTVHFDNVKNVKKASVDFEQPTNNPGWHVWAVEMEPDHNDKTKTKITFLLDDQVIFSHTPTQQNWTKQADPQAMFDIALNMAVGGEWAGHPDDPLGWSRYLNHCLKPYKGTQPCNSSGVLRAEFNKPSAVTYEIDYIRVFTKQVKQPPAPQPQPPQTPDPTPPAPQPEEPIQQTLSTPINVQATPGQGEIKLTWSAVNGANNYTVRWGTNGNWTSYSNDPGRKNPNTNSYTITGLSSGVNYNFSVAARDSTGKNKGSAYSNPIQAATRPPRK